MVDGERCMWMDGLDGKEDRNVISFLLSSPPKRREQRGTRGGLAIRTFLDTGIPLVCHLRSFCTSSCLTKQVKREHTLPSSWLVVAYSTRVGKPPFPSYITNHSLHFVSNFV